MSHARPRRLDAYAGLHRYHFRSTTWNRRPHFRDEIVVRSVRDRLLILSSTFAVEILGYCFMPDHVHVLAQGASLDARPPDPIVRWKQISGYEFQRERQERLWQPGLFDRVLRENESTRATARYIVANPVRAGVVGHAAAYPYSFCAWQEDWSPELQA
jgi:putative transposase